MALALTCARQSSPDTVPVVHVTHHESFIKFYVKASVELAGQFDKWSSTLTFASPDVTSGVLDIEIQADSVDTGSGMKNGKLKGEKFFDVKNNPTISFHSTKVVQTSPTTFVALPSSSNLNRIARRWNRSNCISPTLRQANFLRKR